MRRVKGYDKDGKKIWEQLGPGAAHGSNSGGGPINPDLAFGETRGGPRDGPRLPVFRGTEPKPPS